MDDPLKRPIRMGGVLRRIEELDEKLDACLVLLKMIITHDDFVYTLSNKSEQWVKTMTAAEVTANTAGSFVFRRSEAARLLRAREAPQGDSEATQTAVHAGAQNPAQ